MIGRLALGILNGFIADLAFRLNTALHRSPECWLARRAGHALLRMYALGGGMDEGAAEIYSKWGDAGRSCLEKLLNDGNLPGHHVFYANLLLGKKPTFNLPDA